MERSFSCYKIEQQQKCCYNEWMNLQSKHIFDLKNTLLNNNKNNNLTELLDQIMKDFEDYVSKRYEICHERCSSSYFAPPWNSSLENALLWIGGCRPSSFIRIIYSLCGSQMEKFQLHDAECSSTHGFRSMSELTAEQIKKINEIHMKIVKKEDKISRKVASKQEDVADLPIAVAVYAADSEEGDLDLDIDIDLDKHEEKMANLMVQADKLRIKTLKNIVNVLNPLQAAEFLLAGKRFHVKLHEWGKVREDRRGGCSAAAGGRAAT